MTSSGVRFSFIKPMRLKFPDSYLVIDVFWSAMTSMWTFLRAPVDPPYQLATGSKSSDCFGVRAVILNCPLPMRVLGSADHLSSPPPAVIAFWDTTQAVHRPTSVYQYPAGALSLAEKL